MSILKIKFKQKVPFPFEDFVFDLGEIVEESFHPLLRSDARVLGELIETACDVTFIDITKVNGNQPYDLESLDGQRTIEVRVLGPSTKVNFKPSSKAARIRARTDNSVIFDKALVVSDWVFVKANSFPVVTAIHLAGDDVFAWLKDNLNKTCTYAPEVLDRIKSYTKNTQ
jgi:hypothetical protein